MGYTHYYRYTPDSPDFRAAWPRMVADAQRIVEAVRAEGIVITGFDGDEDEELTGEPFVISPTLDGLPSWEHDEHGVVTSFCKTECYPYDLAVTAILLRCHQIAPEAFQLDSDGEWDEDWGKDAPCPPVRQSTRELVATLFGECAAESPFCDFF